MLGTRGLSPLSDHAHRQPPALHHPLSTPFLSRSPVTSMCLRKQETRKDTSLPAIGDTSCEVPSADQCPAVMGSMGAGQEGNRGRTRLPASEMLDQNRGSCSAGSPALWPLPPCLSPALGRGWRLSCLLSPTISLGHTCVEVPVWESWSPQRPTHP